MASRIHLIVFLSSDILSGHITKSATSSAWHLDCHNNLWAAQNKQFRRSECCVCYADLTAGGSGWRTNPFVVCLYIGYKAWEGQLPQAVYNSQPLLETSISQTAEYLVFSPGFVPNDEAWAACLFQWALSPDLSLFGHSYVKKVLLFSLYLVSGSLRLGIFDQSISNLYVQLECMQCQCFNQQWNLFASCFCPRESDSPSKNWQWWLLQLRETVLHVTSFVVCLAHAMDQLMRKDV